MGLVLPSAGLGLVPACGPSCPLVAGSSPFCHPPLGDFHVEIAFYKRSYLGPAGKEMAPKKKKKREEGNISGYLFLCPCDATDRNLGGTRACLVPLHVHKVMSPQELASGGGRRGGGVPTRQGRQSGVWTCRNIPRRWAPSGIVGPGTLSRAQVVTLREEAAGGRSRQSRVFLTSGRIGETRGTCLMLGEHGSFSRG